MMIYCNYDTLQRKFSETFRKLSENETDKSSTNKVEFTFDEINFAIPLMARANKVTLKTLPCGTPSS